MACDRAALDEMTESMRETVRRDVTAGFRDDDEIAVSAAEVEGTDAIGFEVLEPIARELVREAVAAHAREQATWPAVTDCDRLDAAFAELEGRGIVCRQDFSCCSNCGEAEIGGEMADVEDDGREVIGYVFYHQQDTERAVDGGGVYLKYGPNTDGPDTAEIGQMITAAVMAAGLTADWDGDPNNAVRVRLEWKRRRPAEVG